MRKKMPAFQKAERILARALRDMKKLQEYDTISEVDARILERQIQITEDALDQVRDACLKTCTAIGKVVCSTPDLQNIAKSILGCK